MRTGGRCAKNSGAAEESRTLDLNLGKVALYQLSYCRISWESESFVLHQEGAHYSEASGKSQGFSIVPWIRFIRPRGVAFRGLLRGP
jgi:hypothetical protein